MRKGVGKEGQVSARRVVLVFALSAPVAAGVLAAEVDGTEPGGLTSPVELLSAAKVVPALAGPAFTGGRSGRPLLRLAWIDPADVAAGSGASARDEAKRLLAGMGLDVRWRVCRPDELAIAGEVRVILLDRGAVTARRASVLGATPRTPGEQPHLWVHVPGVRASLGLGPRDASLAEFPARCRVGVAIGRVIAHEVVHVVAPGVPHGRGLMASRFSTRELTTGETPVEPEVALAVRTALLGGRVSPPVTESGLVAVELAGKEVE